MERGWGKGKERWVGKRNDMIIPNNSSLYNYTVMFLDILSAFDGQEEYCCYGAAADECHTHILCNIYWLITLMRDKL